MKLEETKGDWALITGASSGIGREFAVHLAAAGMNLAIVGRRKHLLETLKSELSRQYKVKVVVLPFDLSDTGSVAEISSNLKEEGIKVRLLINNAASGKWGNFEDINLKTYEDMIKLNVLAMVSMCHCFLPDLSSFPTSAIINVSSPAAFNPLPYMAVYASTKAFVLSFSQALYGEWKDRGILVQTLIPGPTKTELGIAASSCFRVFKKLGSPDVVVKTSLAHLATDAPLVINAGGAFRQRLFAALFPAKFVIRAAARLFQPFQGG